MVTARSELLKAPIGPTALVFAIAVRTSSRAGVGGGWNGRGIGVVPGGGGEVGWGLPAVSRSRRSSGAATVAAIVSGSAPGRLAVTLMVGKSTVGMLATGRKR